MKMLRIALVSTLFFSLVNSSFALSLRNVELRRATTKSLPKIMCVGDSITNGVRDDKQMGYKNDLQDLLGIRTYQWVGIWGTSIGPNDSSIVIGELPRWDRNYENIGTYQTRHCGWWGGTTQQVTEYLIYADVMNRFFKDAPIGSMIIIHLGTNDSSKNIDQISVVISYVENFISYVNAFNPDIDIYFCQIVPHATESRDTWTVLYNSAIADFVNSYGKPNLYTVDMHTSFVDTWNGITSNDGVHPNTIGYAQMAELLYAEISEHR